MLGIRARGARERARRARGQDLSALAPRQGGGEVLAALNFGDLFAYALARQLRPPLLFRGEAFSATDVLPVPEVRA